MFSTPAVRVRLRFSHRTGENRGSEERKQRVDRPTAIAINPGFSLRWAFQTDGSFSLHENPVSDASSILQRPLPQAIGYGEPSARSGRDTRLSLFRSLRL